MLVRASAVLTPVVVSVLATILVTHLVPRPGSGLAVVGWWVVLTGFATVIAMLAERVTRRLLPLSALFRLTLVFPDHAPKRYRVALRTGTSRQLAKRVATAHRDGLGETPQEAAEHVVELLAALNAHDRITRGHCERVRAYTDLLARELKLSPEDTSRLHWAGMIHDIGKLEVPAEILNKPGRLTDEEYEIVKRHPEAGARLAAPLADWLGEWRHAIDQHHERWDGRGYPAGLAGEQISLAGRIVAVADVFDVITAARSYKKPSSAVDARCELARCAGTQFDPAVVRAFLNISLGRLRMLVGPLSWLADLPVLGRVPLAPAGAAISAAASMSFFFVSLLLPGQPARASEAPPVPARAVAAAAPAPPAPVAATAPIDGPVASAPVAELLRPPLSDPVLPILPVTPSPAAPIPPAAAPDAPVPSPPTSPPPTVPPVDVPPVDDPPPPPPPTIPPPPPPPPTPPAPPVPAADVATTPQDTAVAIDVMANDAASTGALDPASVVVTAGPAHGTASANGDGSVTYLPTAGYVGTDSFTYTVCDGAACAVGTVTVDVVSVPVLANDSASTTPTAPVVIDVLANDSGALGSLDLATLHVVSGPSSGVATVNVDHTITYTPSSGFSGSDLLVYAVCDVGGGCAVSSATITVSPLAMPTVVPDAFTVAGPVTVDVLANDSGGSGVLDPTSLAIVAAPAAGNAVINVDHTITYTPSGPFASDSFTYQVCDTGGGCAFASVTLSAAAVPAPLTAADTASTAEATPVSIDVLANDSGGTGTLDPTTLAIASAPGSGTTAVVSGQVQYTPHAGFAGTDIFGYQVCDVGGSCAVASVTVTVVNVAPGAADDSALTVKNAAVVIDVLGNDGGDTDIDPSTLTITSAPGIGVVSVSVDRTVTYTPNHDTKGTDTFGYQVCDSHGACSTATVTVTILDADKAPVLGKDFASTLSLLPVTVDVLANDTDPDDQIVPSTLFIKSAPKHGTAVVNPDHTITYTPNLLFIGKDTFKYSVCDSLGTCSEADIEVTVV